MDYLGFRDAVIIKIASHAVGHGGLGTAAVNGKGGIKGEAEAYIFDDDIVVAEIEGNPDAPISGLPE